MCLCTPIHLSLVASIRWPNGRGTGVRQEQQYNSECEQPQIEGAGVSAHLLRTGRDELLGEFPQGLARFVHAGKRAKNETTNTKTCATKPGRGVKREGVQSAPWAYTSSVTRQSQQVEHTSNRRTQRNMSRGNSFEAPVWICPLTSLQNQNREEKRCSHEGQKRKQICMRQQPDRRNWGWRWQTIGDGRQPRTHSAETTRAPIFTHRSNDHFTELGGNGIVRRSRLSFGAPDRSTTAVARLVDAPVPRPYPSPSPTSVFLGPNTN